MSRYDKFLIYMGMFGPDSPVTSAAVNQMCP